MLIQQLDKYGHWNFKGCGRVMCARGSPPFRKYWISETNIPKISFTVTVGYYRLPDIQRTQFWNVTCSVYGTKGNAAMYALAETVQRWDRVEFSGVLNQSRNADGEVFKEIRLDSLIFPDRMAKILLGGTVPKIEYETQLEETKTKTPPVSHNDYLF